MKSTTTQVKTKTTVAIEQQLSMAYRTAVIILTSSGILALALFTTIWKLKI